MQQDFPLSASISQIEQRSGFFKFFAHVYSEKKGGRTMMTAAVYGFAVGDALGVPYLKQLRGTFLCREMIGFGTAGQLPGTWSPNTSLLLATMDSLSHTGTFQTEDLRERLQQWEHFSADFPGIKPLTIGATTDLALMRGVGVSGVSANGSGSLVRMLPFAFIPHTDAQVRAASAITHAHPIVQDACVMYTQIAQNLLAWKDVRTAAYLAQRNVMPRINEPWEPFLAESEPELDTSGYVVHMLEAVLWCISTTDNYVDAVKMAVNLGGQTATTAALTGGLAGIIYGREAIPHTWVEKLRKKDVLDHVIHSFTSVYR